jgi:hypothetical protein
MVSCPTGFMLFWKPKNSFWDLVNENPIKRHIKIFCFAFCAEQPESCKIIILSFYIQSMPYHAVTFRKQTNHSLASSNLHPDFLERVKKLPKLKPYEFNIWSSIMPKRSEANSSKLSKMVKQSNIAVEKQRF